MIAVTIIVVLAAIIAVVVAVSGDGSSNAGGAPSSGVVRSAVSDSASSDTASSDTGSAGTTTTTGAPTGSWTTPYRQFTKLIGDNPGSPGYRAATCKLAGPDDGIPGMVDQVTCSGLSGTSKVVFYVGRFSSGAAVDTYIDTLVKRQYKKQFWTIDSIRRGLLVTSPATIAYADVTSSICAVPEFLIQFYAAGGSGVSEAQLEKDYWKDSIFPDTTPAVCT